jgi:hypothetical protein
MMGCQPLLRLVPTLALDAASARLKMAAPVGKGQVKGAVDVEQSKSNQSDEEA